MRLYLNASSKNNIKYTADTLIVGEYRYDLLGDTDDIDDGVCLRFKGEIIPLEDNTPKLEDLLKTNPNALTDVIISIYPFSETNNELLDNDEISKGDGTLVMNDGQEFPFNFYTEFYGL